MSCIISYLAFDKCGSSMKRKVDWDDEENGESEMEPFEEARETDVSDDEQSNDDEPRIKDVLRNLSKQFPENTLLTCYTAWRLPKISCFGHLADSYSETNE